MQVLVKSGADTNFTDKALFFINQWKGFCLRGFDYSTLPVLNAESLVLMAPDEQLSEEQSTAVNEIEHEVKQQTSDQELQEPDKNSEQHRQLVLKSDSFIQLSLTFRE
jgi:hypothetical protein